MATTYSDYNLSPLLPRFNPSTTMALDSVSPYRDIHPQLAAGAWVHPRATVIGEVTLGRDASVWPGAVIRGDVNSISIGAATNIQDNSVLHVSHKTPVNPAGGPLVIGARVTIGHTVILHACTIADECLIAWQHHPRPCGGAETCAAGRRLAGAGRQDPRIRASVSRPPGENGARADRGRDRLFQLFREHYVKLARSYR